MLFCVSWSLKRLQTEICKLCLSCAAADIDCLWNFAVLSEWARADLHHWYWNHIPRWAYQQSRSGLLATMPYQVSELHVSATYPSYARQKSILRADRDVADRASALISISTRLCSHSLTCASGKVVSLNSPHVWVTASSQMADLLSSGEMRNLLGKVVRGKFPSISSTTTKFCEDMFRDVILKALSTYCWLQGVTLGIFHLPAVSCSQDRSLLCFLS